MRGESDQRELLHAPSMRNVQALSCECIGGEPGKEKARL